MNLSIVRVASDDEFQAFTGLLVAYENSLPPLLRHGVESPPESLRNAYGGRNAAFIATIEGDAAGCVALEHLDQSTSILKRMYVTPRYRQRGLARTLLDAALSFAREQHYERVVLDTDPAILSNAFRFYLSAGFSPCEPYGPVNYPNAAFLELRLER